MTPKVPKELWKKIGRPTKKTPDVVDRICKSLSIGNTQERAAMLVGVSPEKLSEWKAADPSFRETVQRAEAECIEYSLKKIKSMADEGNKCWTAHAWILERRFPAIFGKRLEITTSEDGTLSPDERLARMRAILGIAGSNNIDPRSKRLTVDKPTVDPETLPVITVDPLPPEPPPDPVPPSNAS